MATNKNNSWMRPSEAANYLHISYNTLRAYTKRGLIPAEKTPAGQNVYNRTELDKYLGKEQPTHNTAFYVRTSGNDQRRIDAQTDRLTRAYGKPDTIYTDKASGLNENRKGLQRLIRDAKNNKINTIYITAKERLTRFGYTYLETLLNEYGCTITVLDDQRTDKDLHEELMQDFLALLASFSGKYYKLRSIRHEQMLLKEAEKAITHENTDTDSEDNDG